MSERAAPGLAGSRDATAGFLMMDLLLALAVMALIAALALPFVRAGGQASLRTKAAEIAALLRTSRNAALLSGKASGVTIDAAGGVLRSLRPAGIVGVPRTIDLRTTPPGIAAITFTGDGRSSGGAVALRAGAARLVVRVDPVSAAVAVSGS